MEHVVRALHEHMRQFVQGASVMPRAVILNWLSLSLWIYTGATVLALGMMVVQRVAGRPKPYTWNPMLRCALRGVMFPPFVVLMAAGVVGQAFVDLLDNAKAVLRDDTREYWKD